MTKTPEPEKRPPTVLIVNDQEWSARSVESIVAANGYTVVRAFTGNQALVRAGETMPDLFILDRQLPDLDGVEICRRLRADPRFGVTTPIIITTAGQAGRSQRLEAVAAGAWDFIGQPIDGEILLHKVTTFLEAKRALDGVRTEAFLDEATGLYTRRGLELRAKEIGSEAARAHLPLTCVVLSADSPKLASALTSAEVLSAEVGSFFRHSGRAADAVGRIGPLEFGIIAPATSAEGASQMVERLEAALSSATIGDDSYRVKLRSGVYGYADFSQADADPLTMLERARAALGKASEVSATRE